MTVLTFNPGYLVCRTISLVPANTWLKRLGVYTIIRVQIAKLDFSKMICPFTDLIVD